MKPIIFCPATNSEGHGNDATGAFIPEAMSFAKLHGGEVYKFDNSFDLPVRQKEVSARLEKASGIDTLVFACHGWKEGIQAGYRLRDVPALAKLVAKVSVPVGLTVILYACDTARAYDSDKLRTHDKDPGPGGQGGFASLLSQELEKAGVQHAQVFGHTTEGHCSRNPFVRVFGGGDAQGDWLVEPGTPTFRSWAQHLHAEGSTLRLRYPFMDEPTLVAELSDAPPKQPAARR